MPFTPVLLSIANVALSASDQAKGRDDLRMATESGEGRFAAA
jgi:hypothetical protein